MINRYKERYMKIVKTINSETIKEYAQINHQNTFTRKRKMPLDEYYHVYTF